MSTKPNTTMLPYSWKIVAEALRAEIPRWKAMQLRVTSPVSKRVVGRRVAKMEAILATAEELSKEYVEYVPR